MGKLTVIVPTLNEEENIRGCLESVKWADEIIIVDMYSTDNTLEICREHTHKVLQNDENRVLNININLGIEHATSDWILQIDADERISAELRDEILAAINSDQGYNAYEIHFDQYFFGAWPRHGGWYPIYLKRLFRKGFARYECRIVHETITVDGKVGRLKSPIIHYAHPTIDKFTRKMNLYTTQEAEVKFNEGEEVALKRIVIDPLKEIYRRYIRLRGFKDGGHGLVIALLMGIYVFLARAKLWELNYKSRMDSGDYK